MNGWELSRQFYVEAVRPILRQHDTHIEEQMAAGMFGGGSDVSGLDDEHSREHHWGPRCNILIADLLSGRCSELEALLRTRAPNRFLGYPVYHNSYNRCGITVETVSHFFEDMVGRPHAPNDLEGWFGLTEADLYHITRGYVFHDGPGDLRRRREAFAYYPEPIWRKKIADWLIFLTGHGVYNINRARVRDDHATMSIYWGVALKRILEIVHLLNRTYAPYNKWLYRSFVRLPRLAPYVKPLVDRAIESASWEERCRLVLEINTLINDELARDGLASRHYPSDGSPVIGEAWMYFLYEAAVELYHSIPEALVRGRFNDIEHWEVVVKNVLLDPDWKAGFRELGKS